MQPQETEASKTSEGRQLRREEGDEFAGMSAAELLRMAMEMKKDPPSH